MAPRAIRERLLSRGTALLTATAVALGTGWLAVSPAYADTTPPTAPVNLRISPSPTSTDGRAVLTWDASSGPDVAYYQIFRYGGTATPATDELTYTGRTEDARNYFIDQIPTEGDFRYTVVAVDAANNASPASTWVSVAVDLAANGIGVISPDVTAPPAVAGLAVGSAISSTRTASLSWSPSEAPDLGRYLVYRTSGSEAARMVAYVTDAHAFTDTLAADGAYSYHVIAQDQTGNPSPASVAVTVVIDATAPVVQMTAPVSGQVYPGNTSLTITATVDESGSGYDAAALKYYLDGALLNSPTVDLTALAVGNHVAKAEVTDRAGNSAAAEVTFGVAAATASPAAPQNLTAPAFSKSRSISLSWAAPLTGSATQYTVYRSNAGAAAAAVGTTLPSVTQFTDTVAADGTYSYFVVAENGTTAGEASLSVTVVVDTVAPTIVVTAPEANKQYGRSGTLTVQATVSDQGSGYDPAKVAMSLDGTGFTGTSIDLAALSVGNHSFQVTAEDRAGNASTKTVRFAVGTVSVDTGADTLIDLLISLRPQIHRGQYTSLMAKARNGNLESLIKQVSKFRGKFISADAANQLLAAAAELGGYDHDDD